MDASKGQIENFKLEDEDMMKENINTHIVESVVEKNTQVKTCAKEISR
jgi:hypothetical protein